MEFIKSWSNAFEDGLKNIFYLDELRIFNLVQV
jgi:hypothetical protein